MSTYRHPDPAVRAQMRQRLWAHRRKHPLRRYGHDSLRWNRPRQDAADQTARIRRHLAALIVLTAAAIGIIGWDIEARHHTMNLPRPVEQSQSHSSSSPHPTYRKDHR